MKWHSGLYMYITVLLATDKLKDFHLYHFVGFSLLCSKIYLLCFLEFP